MADVLKLKKGPLARLDTAEFDAGSLYITTDEVGLYIDVQQANSEGTLENIRARIGDLVVLSSLNEWEALPRYSESALYYITNGNMLLKYSRDGVQTDDGIKHWIQINSVSDSDAVAQTVKNLETTVGNHTLQIADAAEAASNAQNTADNALSKAESAQSTADSAAQTAESAQSTASNALSKAESAQTTASNADTKASEAKTDASEAKTMASEAKTDASTAKADASTALNKADTAQTTANNALGKASTAEANASDAKADASTALNTANAANTTAGEAKELAQTAASDASTAKTDASTALTTAGNADTKADAAKEEASAANATAEEAKKLAQTAASDASQAKSDATTAKANAATALTKAEAAQTAAGNAEESAQAANNNAANAVEVAGTAKTTANEAKELATSANNTAEAAKTAANEAKSKAETVETTANNAYSQAGANASAITALQAKDAEIEELIANVNSMTFKGIVEATLDGNVLNLPVYDDTTVKAGDTYVVSGTMGYFYPGGHVVSDNIANAAISGEATQDAYAGDLIIATSAWEGNDPDTENLDNDIRWYRIQSGFSTNALPTLSASSNQILLNQPYDPSINNGKQGILTFVDPKENEFGIKMSSDNNNNITLSLVWGEF